MDEIMSRMKAREATLKNRICLKVGRGCRISYFMKMFFSMGSRDYLKWPPIVLRSITPVEDITADWSCSLGSAPLALTMQKNSKPA